MPDLSFFRHTGFGLGSSILCFTSPAKRKPEAESFDCRWSLCVVMGRPLRFGAYTAVLTNAVGLFSGNTLLS